MYSVLNRNQLLIQGNFLPHLTVDDIKNLSRWFRVFYCSNIVATCHLQPFLLHLSGIGGRKCLEAKERAVHFLASDGTCRTLQLLPGV